ncbi:UDP-N-acetylmuramate dehydrogenase [Phorcysia thermohydrogeniphila]|uniref:UDP-N-acetylenolpyruvoylglucosamine reductase n=1 Tax=Phorcysia thermohydrogeniphila TaxID=936138 RepID=A0A4V2PDR6_9BACT|nr:UDP-N-acetylmuramate dehydrogenase [Phorcysia thermohydrogeniphila]TCK06296.1 UDP-N-acetylmuramate dehydrogenase [Phorcysia thermohydrogeniphila]
MEVRELSAKELTTIGIGSSYPVYFPENLEELKSLLRNEDIFIIGGGSNTVLSEKLNRKFVSLRKFRNILLEEDRITVGAGVKLSELLALQIQKKFSLFEFLAGIPKATVGGLVAQNAGAFGHEIKDRLVEVKFLSRETLEVEVLRDFSEFGYRKSPFPELGAVVEATFKIFHSQKVKEEMKKFVSLRLEKQPPFYLRTAGSTFKNPPGDSAGRLLDLAGLKGFSVGGVKFSEFHANFIVNEGGSFSEFLELVEMGRKKVKEKFGVDLELEVRVIT